jgi:hypothetical protein
MKILLVGEYNRAHWNVKEGLKKLGHEALTVGMKDGFKKVDVDVEIKNPFENFFLKKIRRLIYRLFKIDLLGIYVNHSIKSKKTLLSNYDIIQFISESAFVIDNKSQLKAFKLLSSWNKNVFILSAGKDYPSISYAYGKKLRYSILTPYLENNTLGSYYKHAIRYLEEDYKVYHNYVYSKINGVIACDMDYHIPLEGHPKYLGLIPHAINIKQLKYTAPKIDDKIIIFHGINTSNYYMKGNFIFEEALVIIEQKYGNKVDIISVKNLPYKAYLKSFEKCHILLDQTFSYDLGYNALEAMAMEKVVFSGVEKEWLKYYNIEEDTVAINALPNADSIVEKLEWLIKNPELISVIGKNARGFVIENHDHFECAKKYINKWSEKINSLS